MITATSSLGNIVRFYLTNKINTQYNVSVLVEL
jgi:hypothetical protein